MSWDYPLKLLDFIVHRKVKTTGFSQLDLSGLIFL